MAFNPTEPPELEGKSAFADIWTDIVTSPHIYSMILSEACYQEALKHNFQETQDFRIYQGTINKD